MSFNNHCDLPSSLSEENQNSIRSNLLLTYLCPQTNQYRVYKYLPITSITTQEVEFRICSAFYPLESHDSIFIKFHLTKVPRAFFEFYDSSFWTYINRNSICHFLVPSNPHIPSFGFSTSLVGDMWRIHEILWLRFPSKNYFLLQLPSKFI